MLCLCRMHRSFFFFFNLNRTIILCYMMAEERSGVSVLIM